MRMRSGQATPTEQRKLQPHKSRGKSLIPMKAKRVKKVQLFPLRWLPKNPPHSKPTASSSSITLTVIPTGSFPENSMKLPVGITVKVIDELLAVGLEWGGFFGSHRSGNSWTFLTLFAFIGIRLFPRLLWGCSLRCSVGVACPLLILITVVTCHENYQPEKHRGEQGELQCSHNALLLANQREN